MSGCIGLAYEIVYLNILAVYFYGDSWLINSSILIGVFAGLAIGSIFAGKLVRHLWLMELLLGIMSLALGVLLKSQGLALMHYIPEENLQAIFTAFMSGFIPLFIIGSHIPCYNMIIHDNLKSGRFTLVYAIYSIAAAAAILFTAYWLIPVVGAVNCIIVFGVINIFLAGVLMPTCQNLTTKFTIKCYPVFWLLVLGAASTLWQSLFLDSAIGIYGHYNEIIILVIFVSILGNSLGSFASYKIPSTTASLYGVLICLGIYIITTDSVLETMVRAQETINPSVLIITLMTLHGLAVFICFGALIPQLAAPEKNGSWVLGFFSIGNGLGIVIHSLFLRGQQSLDFSILLIAALLFFYLYFKDKSPRRRIAHLLLAAGITGLGYYKYPSELLLLGINSRATPEVFAAYRKDLQTGALTVENYSTVNNIVYALHRGADWEVINNGYLRQDPREQPRTTHQAAAAAQLLQPDSSAINTYMIGSASGGLLAALTQTRPIITLGEITPAKLKLIVEKLAIDETRLTVIPGDSFVLLAKNSSQYEQIIMNDLPLKYFSNAKFYTEEFYALVQKKLTPNGVFVIKAQYRSPGDNTIIQTLQKVFPACRHFSAPGSNHLHLCAATPAALMGYRSNAVWAAVTELNISPTTHTNNLSRLVNY